MPRQPKLRKNRVGQTTYWYTDAGVATYFGNVDAVPFVEARNLFNDHVRSLSYGAKDSNERCRTAGQLMDLFLDWMSRDRSADTYETRRTACSRFGASEVGQQKVRDLHANKVKSHDLASFLEYLDKDLGLGVSTRRHSPLRVRHGDDRVAGLHGSRHGQLHPGPTALPSTSKPPRLTL
jgi:hypothetical protein